MYTSFYFLKFATAGEKSMWFNGSPLSSQLFSRVRIPQETSFFLPIFFLFPIFFFIFPFSKFSGNHPQRDYQRVEIRRAPKMHSQRLAPHKKKFCVFSLTRGAQLIQNTQLNTR
jgi:hypothetical protein